MVPSEVVGDVVELAPGVAGQGVGPTAPTWSLMGPVLAHASRVEAREEEGLGGGVGFVEGAQVVSMEQLGVGEVACSEVLVVCLHRVGCGVQDQVRPVGRSPLLRGGRLPAG